MRCPWEVLACTLLLFVSTARAELNVEPDPLQLVATRLEGNWEFDENLSTRLDDKAPRSKAKLAFVSDPTVLKKIPSKIAADIQRLKLRIYLAGVMHEGQEDKVFFLTVVSGNPVIVLFRRSSDGELAAGGDGAVMIAPGRDRKNDLLFICESYEDAENPEKPSTPYRRVMRE